MSIESMRASGLPSSLSRETHPPASESPAPGPFATLVAKLGKEVQSGEVTMRLAQSGSPSLTTAELLALQAGVYRYSEAVDLTSKLIDRTTSGVKTVLQGQ